jgi:hypothetical protein
VNSLKRHLTVANVLSCIALFVALSATAVAATKLGTGQVKAVNIATGAVTNPKLKNLGVTSSKIANGTIVTGKLKGASVTAGKLGKEAVTTNKLKKKAVTGATLAAEAVTTGKLASSLYGQLVKNVTYEGIETATTESTEKTAIATCPAGKQAIGGGVRVNGTLKDVAVTGTQPYLNGTARTGWEGFARDVEADAVGGPWSLTVFAVCAEL